MDEGDRTARKWCQDIFGKVEILANKVTKLETRLIGDIKHMESTHKLEMKHLEARHSIELDHAKEKHNKLSKSHDNVAEVHGAKFVSVEKILTRIVIGAVVVFGTLEALGVLDKLTSL